MTEWFGTASFPGAPLPSDVGGGGGGECLKFSVRTTPGHLAGDLFMSALVNWTHFKVR